MPDHQTLYAIYDLKNSPANFGINQFVEIADAHRRTYGFSKVQGVVIYDDTFFDEDCSLTPLSLDERQFRLRNLVEPSFHLIPGCIGNMFFLDRNDAQAFLDSVPLPQQIFPSNYRIDNPIVEWTMAGTYASYYRGEEVFKLTAPYTYLYWAKQFLESNSNGRKVITISMREESYGGEGRNSKLEDWKQLSHDLEDRGYATVFIRDTATFMLNDGIFDGYWTCPMASQDILFRSALYQVAHTNIGGAGGGIPAAQTVGAPFCQVNVATDNYVWANETYFERNVGTVKGWHIPVAPKNQEFVWVPDDYDSMKEPILSYLDTFESRPQEPWGFKNERNRELTEELVLNQVESRLTNMRYVFPHTLRTLEGVARTTIVNADRVESLIDTLKSSVVS